MFVLWAWNIVSTMDHVFFFDILHENKLRLLILNENERLHHIIVLDKFV